MAKKKRGRPAKKHKPIESFVEEIQESSDETAPVVSSVNEPAIVKSNGEKLCACGEPVAPGQSEVCKKHIRSS